MNDKLKSARELIVKALNHWSRPCVLWSGGKDSMVLLHLLRSMLGKIPVVCWREPWFSYKNAFVNRIIEEWELEVWDWHPAKVALTKGNGRIDILNYYPFGHTPEATVMLSRGVESQPAEGEKLVCGKDTVLSRPVVSNFIPPWDVCFHGHKSADVDLIQGNVPLEVDLIDAPGQPACAFPLRHWSDADIFNYLEEHEVPIDLNRYEKTPKGWKARPYQRLNPDFLPLCLKCCDPDEGEFVDCFKLKMRINNISQNVRWEKPNLPYANIGGKE